MPKMRSVRRAFSQFIGSAVGFRADAGLGVVGSPSPDSDFYYHSLGQRSAAGPNVSGATAIRLAAVFACTRVCAETLASLPIGIYRELKSGGREPARDHPAQELFLEPNPWQTGMEFFEMLQGHLELRGNAYALKVPGGGRAIDQLIPLHPDRVKVYLLPDHRLRYEVTSYSSGQIDKYNQEQILHLRAWSSDGIMGMSTISAGAEVIGVGLAQQEHRARFFHNSAIPGLAVETTKLTTEATEILRASLAEGFSGSNAFKAMIVPPNMTVKALGVSNKDSQLIEAGNATRTDICGMFRVPPHKVGDLSKGTFSNIEQQNIEFATDCMRPRIVRFERRLDRDIVGSLRAFESAAGDYYVTFNMDALFRGDMKSRYEAMSQGINSGWLVRNEARASEGKNPIEGLDEPLVAVNMETVSQAQKRSDANLAAAQSANDAPLNKEEADTQKNLNDSGGAPETLPTDGPADEEQNSQSKLQESKLRALAIAAAGRVVRREVKALRKLALKAQDGPGIEGEIWDFYRDLAPVVAEALVIPLNAATLYCNAHAAVISTVKSTLLDMAIDRIEEEEPVTLANIAMGERHESKPPISERGVLIS
jgi:HK97 family phage portal protein